MYDHYFPILRAMAGEFAALEHTEKATADKMVPLFEVPRLPKRKSLEESTTPIVDFLQDTCCQISKVWNGRPAMFDTFAWDPAKTTELGEHIIPTLFNKLKSMNVSAIPVIGYDRWEISEYKIALQQVAQSHSGTFCIRLEHHAIEDSYEPDYFLESLDDIIESLQLVPSSCHILMDFEDVTALSAVDLMSRFDSLYSLLASYNFSSISIAGCSLPNTIDKAVKKHNTCGTVVRKEILLWKDARKQHPRVPIFYGDYGVRGPNTVGAPNPNTNGKIRYTKSDSIFIARGHSMKQPPKGMQHCELARKVIASGHYMGAEFSWGDSKIEECSYNIFGGHAPTWIKIDTNHHLAFVVAEIAEFERTIVTASTVSAYSS